LILLLDNYDSFVFILDRYLQQLGQSTLVVRSDAITVDVIERSNFEAIVISPGPKAPDQAGCSLEVVRRLHSRIPILGVCLGHQCIVQALGGKIIRSPRPRHGTASMITHNGSRLFVGLPASFAVARYHSLMANPESMPSCLSVTSTSEDDVIMSVEHTTLPIFGVQFHPESILTQFGHALVKNFLVASGIRCSQLDYHSELELTIA
jgi:anthranilate synthase component II